MKCYLTPYFIAVLCHFGETTEEDRKSLLEFAQRFLERNGD